MKTIPGPLTTKEVLDLAETPSKNGDINAVEATLLLAGGCARSTHRFVYLETRPRKGRVFDHFMNISDAWEEVTEKWLVGTYGTERIWVDVEKED